MGFGYVFLGIMGIFLWGFIIYWMVQKRKNHHEPTAQDIADDQAAEKALDAEEHKK